MIGTRPRTLAVHVCADLPSLDERLPRSAVRSAGDTLARMSRVCAAAGIRDQRRLVGPDATTDRLRDALTGAAADLDPSGLLVLTFAGHSDRRRRDAQGRPVVRWCLYDGGLGVREVAEMLGTLRSTTRVVVVADTCYAGAFAHTVDVACALVLVGACADNQTTISGPTSEFAVRLEDLVGPGDRPDPTGLSYRWLKRQLQWDTPDAERPVVWTNRESAWDDRPFHLPPPTAARRRRLAATGHASEGR